MNPPCKCHGAPAYWNKDRRYRAGGFWACAVKKRRGYHRLYHEGGGREKTSIRKTARTISKYETLLGALEREEAWLMEHLGLASPTPTRRTSGEPS